MANEQRLIDVNGWDSFYADLGDSRNMRDSYDRGYTDALDRVDDWMDAQPTIDALPLRCHMGDTVWIVGTKCGSGLYESECHSDKISCSTCPLDREYTVYRRSVKLWLFAYIHGLEHSILFRWGETVFKTQEEAEAALAKMKEADHGK